MSGYSYVNDTRHRQIYQLP